MKAEERQKRLEDYLQATEFAALEELAQHVGASVSTVRRDLTELEKTGNIRRTHGGARLINPKSDEFAFLNRDTRQPTEKDSIGKLCADLIQPGQSVIMDAGTTVYHVARQLEGKTLQVLTNSLPVANHFAASQQVEVIVSGGVIYPRLGVLVGPLAEQAFSKTHADVAIMGGGGITLDGVTNSHALLIAIQQAMIQAAAKVIFCFDHTKFDRRSVAQLCDLTVIDTIVTDAKAPAALVQALRNSAIEVLVAPETVAPAALAPPPSPLPAPATPKKTVIKPRRRPTVEKAPVESPTPPAAPSDSSDGRMGWA